MKHLSIITGAWVCVLAFSAIAQGHDYEIEWYTIDAGSAVSTGGEYVLSGTIGQPDAGVMSNVRFHLIGGFWNVCRASSPALPDPLCLDNGFGTKNRYLSFQAGDPGRSQAVQVTFTSLPGCEYAEGRTAWIQQPFEVTEASGSNGPAPPPTFWAATLGCSPYYTDWTQYNTVDVYDAGIVPDGAHEVRVIDSTCSTDDPNSFVPPLEVRMSEAGDVVGNSPGPAPQGVVDFVDIAAVVDKFKNSPGSIRKARADITNGNLAVADPDRKVDFVDISCVVSAFRAEPCPVVGPPVVDPCP